MNIFYPTRAHPVHELILAMAWINPSAKSLNLWSKMSASPVQTATRVTDTPKPCVPQINLLKPINAVTVLPVVCAMESAAIASYATW